MSNLRVGRRRELLLEAGERVIARVGLEGATTRAVVTEAGMPLASFHYAFTSREEFVRLLLDRHVTPRPLPLPEGGTFEEALTAFLTALAGQDAEDGDVAASLAFHAMRHDGLRAVVAERAAQFDDGLADDLASLAADRGREWLVDPHRLAGQLNCWRFGSNVREAFLRRARDAREARDDPPGHVMPAPHPPADVSTCVRMLLSLSGPAGERADGAPASA